MARKPRGKKPRRSTKLTTAIALLIVAGIGVVQFLSGRRDFSSIWDWLGWSRSASQVEIVHASVPIPKSPNAIRVGTFNIQVFGQSKLDKPAVMSILADVARQFDVLAIQEIRTQDDRHVEQFLQMINAGGRKFDAIVGPRLGRSSSTEQYAFLYDTETIEVVPGSVYTIEDRLDLLHREPLIASFRVRGPPPERAFSFRLINIHTDPDETKQELDALGDVFSIVQQQSRPFEDDVILLGDLNVPPQRFGRLGYLPGITPVITNQYTNVRGSSTLDNIVFDRRHTVEALGPGGVMSLTEMYGISFETLLEISDHLPVWADFSKLEGSFGGLADLPDGDAR